jgi:uncharacterized protein YcbK (DUF882 family)
LISIDRHSNRRHLKATVWPRWLTGLMLALSFLMLAAPAARAETRTLKLFFVHTKEKAEITYKRNGRYDPAGLKKINMFLRDWRRNEPTKMDPRLLDAVWEAYRSVGARDYIHVVSAYRSPATNSMLRKRSKGVANKSQHMLGKAMDFYIPGVSLKKLRDAGLKAQAGGVGYYPRSGSPFVHMDVGNVRHWPRMSRKELVAVFPNGKTLHVPSDGKPLPGFETALASYESRKKSGGTALALASASKSTKSRSGGLLSALFGGGADEEEDNSAAQEVASARPAKPTAEVRAGSGNIQIVPPELANPADIGELMDAPPADETPETIIAALPERDIPLPGFAPRPQADVGPRDIPFGMAEALPEDVSEAALEDEAHANVPVPTWRPDLSPQSQEDAQSALLAMAVPLPEGRPETDEVTLASLSSDPEDDIAAEVEMNNERLAVLSAPATVRDALAKGADPASVIASVKTTQKAARARVADTKPAPKPLVVAAQPEAARWALAGTGQLAYAAGPEVARHIVRTVPNEVYTAGFQRNAVVADAGRFTGKAVSFMPVARFATN